MKKKLLGLVLLTALGITLGACGKSPTPPTSDSSSIVVPAKRYTVGLNVDGERWKTLSVKEGELIPDAETLKPSKDGHTFDYWMENGVQVDLTTYVVTKDVNFDAKFSPVLGDLLDVDAEKEAGKDYFMVFGWWEVQDEAEPDKKTSHLTRDLVRTFGENMLTYLEAKGATEEEIANVQFRNYSTAKVADMGALVNADADVDILVGVGANVFTTAGCLPWNTTDDSKFQMEMGYNETEAKWVSRYVAVLKDASDLAKQTYDWLDSEVGHKVFKEELSKETIQGSLGGDVINLTVNVHGDTVATTVLDDKEDVIAIPTITVPAGKVFKGFSTTEGGELALEVAIDATLKWADVKDLATGDTLDLYPVFIDAPVVTDDLVVYVQVNGTNLTAVEAGLLQARFTQTLTDETVAWHVVEGNADAFTSALGDDADVIIGGNTPLKNYGVHADGPLANAGAKHFRNTSRKVLISNTCNAEHLTLAKKLYDFVVADAIALEVHSTFWIGENNKWVSTEEIATIKAGIEAQLNTLLGIAAEETLLDIYNITLTWYEALATKVADLGTETLALRDGKGTDLIIGCGKNVTSTGGVETVAKKQVSLDQLAADRYVALIKSNILTDEIYNNYFIEKVEA